MKCQTPSIASPERLPTEATRISGVDCFGQKLPVISSLRLSAQRANRGLMKEPVNIANLGGGWEGVMSGVKKGKTFNCLPSKTAMDEPVAKMADMDDNPYKAPAEKSLPIVGFVRWPTVNEWLLLAILAVLLGALFLPDVDDSRQDVLRRYRQKATARPGPPLDGSASQQ